MTALQQYIDIYTACEQAFAAHSPQCLTALRPEALQALQGASLPTKGQEDYEGTDLEEVFAPDYGVNVNRVDFTADVASAFSCGVPNMSTCQYFFVNDTFSAGHTARPEKSSGIVVESFAQAQKNHPEVLKQHLGRLAKLDKPEVALNTLLAEDGMLVYIPDGVVASKPIQLVNIYNAAQPVMAVRRILIVVGRGASARMLVCDHTQKPDVSYLASQVVEIVAQEGSTFDYYDLEETGETTHRVSSVFVEQQEGSNVLLDGITLLNGFTRNDYYVDVAGSHCETQLLGMTIASGRQHVDNHTLLRHLKPNCNSNEMFKYVLSDHALGAFAGKILVEPGCPKTNAYQGNRNILADSTAKMLSKPQLEIYTDDVQCSHGTAIGQLDDEALFYMRTRGIPEAQARQMLMQAFVTDVIDGVRLEALKDRLHHLVEMRFSGQLATCSTCNASCMAQKH